MMKPITTEQVGSSKRRESQGSLTLEDSYLTVQGILHLTYVDDAGNKIDLDVDPVSQPVISPASKKENSTKTK